MAYYNIKHKKYVFCSFFRYVDIQLYQISVNTLDFINKCNLFIILDEW